MGNGVEREGELWRGGVERLWKRGRLWRGCGREEAVERLWERLWRGLWEGARTVPVGHMKRQMKERQARVC